jgi:hypothetical protein
MDSIEERYSALKSITGIALVIGLMIAFGNLLSLESMKIELLMKKYSKRRLKF